MATTIAIRTTLLKTLLLLLVINGTVACSKPHNNPPQADATTQTVAHADSAGKNKGFKWEHLQIVSNQLLTTKVWGQVNYNLQIKTANEKQSVDGQVTLDSLPTGGIGGVETPEIDCK